VDPAATLDMAMATVDALRAVSDEAAFLLRTVRTAEAMGLPLRVRRSWAGRPKLGGKAKAGAYRPAAVTAEATVGAAHPGKMMLTSLTNSTRSRET